MSDRRHRDIEIGVGVDDDRVLAAHLGDDTADVALAGLHDGAAGDDVEADLRAIP